MAFLEEFIEEKSNQCSKILELHLAEEYFKKIIKSFNKNNKF